MGHVAAAWLTDPEGAPRRLPPVGDDPQKLVRMLLHNGIDPTQREGMRGLTPFDAFRGSVPQSPWLMKWADDEKKVNEFKETLDAVSKLMAGADDAMKKKVKGNKALADKKYEEAISLWSEGRDLLEAKRITGHHVAVLWSNEAICCKQMGDSAGCKQACDEGLKHFCLPSVKAKLEKNLVDASIPPEEQPEAKVSAATMDPDKEKELQERRKAALAAKEQQKYKKGFLVDSKNDLYGAEGSVQGKMPQYYNDARGIRIPINQPEGKGPKPIIVPMPEMPSDSD